MSYVDEVLARVKTKNAAEPEFLQAVDEVLESIRPVVEANEELYKKEAILERITEPDRQFKFRVAWVDDNGQVQVNTGYRVQFNNAIGRTKVVCVCIHLYILELLNSLVSSRFSRTP